MGETEFVQLLAANQGIIGKVCSLYCGQREDYEDLFQEIIYQAWKGYGSFRGESKFSTWLYRIALNTAISSLRRRRPEVMAVAELPDHFSEGHGGDDRFGELLWAIPQLGEGDRAITALYLEDMSYREIAEVTGISEGNVGVKINRIKQRLRTIMLRT